jgi:hypothetical protein
MVFWVATPETIVNQPRNGGFWGWPLKAKKGGMLLFPALGGLWDEGRHGQKAKKFWKIVCQILIVNISASEPRIEKILKKVWRDGHHYKTIRIFLGADEKTAAQKPRKSQNFGYPL